MRDFLRYARNGWYNFPRESLMQKKGKQLFLIVLSAFLISGCEKGTRHEDADRFSPRKYEGTEIVVLANKHPWIDLISPRLQQFTAITGIEVLLEIYPEEQFRIKRMVEMLSGVSKIDLFMLMPGNSLDAYVQGGWVEGLSSYLADPGQSWPDYDFEDIFATARKAGIRGEEHYTLPIMLETSLLAYNKQILNDLDLKVPETMEELEETARSVYESSDHRIYGITMRGKRGASTSQWIDFVRSFGGDWLDKDGRAALHSIEAQEASRFYGRLLRLYGPPSAPSNGWYESTSLFMRGKAAMIYDANVFNSNYENPHVSKVAGNIGYAVIPAGPAGASPHASSWGLSLYTGSDNKEAAWYFMQWATEKENALASLQNGIPAARQSIWQTISGQKTEISQEWINASLASYDKASTDWNPPVVDINQGREIVSAIITAAILDRNISQTAVHSSGMLTELMISEKEGRD